VKVDAEVAYGRNEPANVRGGKEEEKVRGESKGRK